MRRVDDDQEVRPPDVAIDDQCAHGQVCDVSGNRVHQCATAVVTAKGDKPSGKFQHSGMNEIRRRILATLATNMNDDVGQTCETSGVSDCIATVLPVTIVTQSIAAVPTNSAVPSTAGIAASSHGTVGVDVWNRRAPIEPMECDKKYDDNRATAVANLDDILRKHDWMVEIYNALEDRNADRKRRWSYIGDNMIKVGPECHCNVNSPPCDAESGSTTVTSLLRRRTGAAIHSATEDGRARTSDVDTSSVWNVKAKAAPTSRQLRKQPETPKLPPSADAADPDAAVFAKRLPESTLGVTNNRNEGQMYEQPDTFVTEIDPTTKSLQAALSILGANGVFNMKVVTWQLMMEMREVVKQQPREQREAHWQRLLGYLHEAKCQLPEMPRQWPPDPGDELRNERERGTEKSDVNIFCRDEQNRKGADDLVRNQNRPGLVQQVWKRELEKLCLARQMPTKSAYASNMRKRDSSSQTTRTQCDSQMLRMQEGAGAPNLAEQPCRQRTDLQQADGRLQSHSHEQVPAVPAVGLTGTSIFDNADSECIQLFGRSSDHRVTDANVGNEDRSIIDLLSLESQGNPSRSPVEAHDDFAMTTTKLVTNATDLSSRDHFTPVSCDATLRTNAGIFSAWANFDLSDEEDVDDDMLPLPRAMQAARKIEHSGYKLGPTDSWFAFIEESMPVHPTVRQLHACMRHYTPTHLYGSVIHFNGHDDDEQFDMTVDGMRIPGRKFTRAHMEMPDGVTCEQCKNGRIQAIRLQRDNGSIETANGTKRDIESTPDSADGRAETSSAKRMRRACAGTSESLQSIDAKVEIEDEVLHMPETSQGTEQRGWTVYSDCDPDDASKRGADLSQLNLIQLHPVRQRRAVGQLPVGTGALHFQPFSVKPLAARVALSVAKVPAEHVAQARSIKAKTVQRDNVNAGADQQRGSNAGRHAVKITVQIDQEHSSEPRIFPNRIPTWPEWQAIWAERSANNSSVEPMQQGSIEVRVKCGGAMDSDQSKQADCQ